MWGNQQGWLISGVIVLVMAGLLYMLAAMDTVSKPTSFGTDDAVLAALPPVGDVASVLAMTEEGDAGEHYRKAIASYRRNARAYEKFEGSVNVADAAPLREGIDAVVAGTRLSRMSLFAGEPGSVISYDSEASPVNAIKGVGMAACRLGLLLKDDDEKRALQLFEAAFALGAKLFQERVTYQECFAGLELMGQSVGYIGKLSDKLGDKPRAEAAKAFDVSRQAFYKEHMEATARVVTSIDPNVMGRHVGDVFVIAERSQEKMWRVEAIRKLGLIRHAAMTRKRRGDELGAVRAARKYAQDPDPAIAAAGKLASELDVAGFNSIR